MRDLMDIEIRRDNLQGAEIARLLREHLDDMRAITPPGSVHALALGDLRQPGISFWSAWRGDELLGCGALRELDACHGEVKSMRTVRTHRGSGVGSTILSVIIAEARRRGYRDLSLETGALAEFAATRAFYERRGFTYRGPFGDYGEDPNSVFMIMRLGD